MPRRSNIAESDAPAAHRADKRDAAKSEGQAGMPAPQAHRADKRRSKLATGQAGMPAPQSPPDPREHGWLRIRGARHNNLKNVTVDIPLSRFVCVTGVSGSGKSSLINDILGPVLGQRLNGESASEIGTHDGIDGIEQLDKAIVIDQSPIGRTPRSNPATYIKLFDEIRKLYHQLPDSQVRGYLPGRFSFNVPTDSGGGRCEACEGNGATRIEMDFLADVWVTCPVCNGKRFNFETLQVHFKGKSIFDVLDMDVQQALTHFEAIPKVRTMLQTLHDVGLDYVKLGQSSTTLSGGEAQRIKLARELVRQSTGQTLYLLDEPTTGLHFEDIRRLLAVLHGFVDAGNTVVCIEHNLDVIKTADWIIDMGPEGGAGGGRVVAVGTPEDIARVEASHTGQALREVLPANGEYRIANSEKKQKKANLSNPQSVILNSQLKDSIVVVGAKEHNLKDLTVNIPRGAMTVCSGVSGSGKTSFAIDTVYTEGQRRYVESLSSYARQFLGQLAKPKVDHVYGLSPAIAIEQKTASKSPRSTVGTITEIYDYMRVLWARVGQPYCPKCDIPIGTQTSDEIVAKLMGLPEGSRVMLAAPIERGPAESWDAVLIRCKAGGYARVRIDGKVHELGEELNIDARRQHAVELVVDRVVIKAAGRGRTAESVEHSLAVGKGVMTAVVTTADEGAAAEQTIRFSQHLACSKCATSYESLSPHHFSFNARLGWCPACEGLGIQRGTSPDTVLVRPHMSILNGAVAGWEHAREEPLLKAMLVALAGAIGFDANAPVSTLTPSHRRSLLFGLGERWIAVESKAAPGMRFQWKGFFPAIDEAVKMSWQYRGRMEDIVAEVDCQTCGGGRIRADAAAVRVSGKALVDVCSMPLDGALGFFRSLKLDTRNKKIAADLLREVTSRLEFLNEVGLEYLTLNRSAPTLSGGEAQRIRLASQIGSGLTGVLYVLDEPTIGLHPRDNHRLITALHRLRDLGNTLLMVEHDREVIAASDHVIDFGPGAGSFGGHIVGADAPAKLKRHEQSLTGKYLSGEAAIPVPTNRRAVEWGDAVPKDADCEPPALIIRDARQHNLKGIDVAIPLGRFVCVTGVSGSGKSSLITDILRPALEVRIHRARATIGLHGRIDGVDHVDKIISVDQQPIGNSPLSNPATYTGVFDLMREHFAKLPDAKVRGFTANRFSFNRPGGRCEACEGQGQVCHEMHFLPDVWTTCETCNGARYNAETLLALFKGKSIADVLNMSAAEAIELFTAAPKIRKLLQTLIDVGLGYLPLGQSAATLSGGEAQRVKLAAELARPNTGRTLYVLDEPTTGLHFDDLRKLLDVLHRLVDLGNTVVCIEHNLDVIKTADWIIDMGPEAGAGGGTVVAAGTPEQVANSEYRIANSETRNKKKAAKSGSKNNSLFAIRYSPFVSYTGSILAGVLAAGPQAERPRFDPKAAAAAALKEEKDRAAAAKTEANVKMPWERDGKRWHTSDRVSREGHKIEWEGKALSFIVDTIEKIGGDKLLPTDWNDRSRVEIKARAPEGIAQADISWFCHILTGAQWLLDVSIRAPRKLFSESGLQKKLGLKTLDQRDDIHSYGSCQRVRLRQANADYDQIRIQVHDLAEINTPAFKSFLNSATTLFLKHVAKLAKNAEQVAPWKGDGKAWHLSQQSIRNKTELKWKPTTLLEMIGRMTKCLPGMRVDWSKKVTLALFDSGDRRIGTIVTNHGEGLLVQIAVPPGRFTPTQIERLGIEQEVISADYGSFVQFRVQTIDQVDTATLALVMKATAELAKAT